MIWLEIKQAVAAAGIKDEDEICLIQCDEEAGNRTFHQVRIGNALKLVENCGHPQEVKEAEGCAT